MDLDAVGVESTGIGGTDYQVLYYLIPPQGSGRSDQRSARFLRTIMPVIKTKRVILISTTGVYGDYGGQWIDETAALRPKAERAFRRIDAENKWRDWSERAKIPLTILRVAGLYGPHRLPLSKLQKAEPVLSRSESPWSNRIYSKDLVAICYRAANSAFTGVLNAVDGNPSTMTDYFFQVADAMGLPRPPEISFNEAEKRLSPGMLSYLRESKKIKNNLLIKELDIYPEYPTLESGLQDIVLNTD